MNKSYRIRSSNTAPEKIINKEYAYPSYKNGTVFPEKKTGKLPIMGWNSWNAFGSGNTEELTKAIAEKLIELGLDKLGYKYLVLDDGCYLPERVNGKLSNEPVKFPSGFRALSDHIHSKGLKFGMYNDVGTHLCAGANVGTCGYEDTDAESYIEWGVDFLKIDNCYYPWDNATFSSPENAKFVFAPNIKGIKISGNGSEKYFSAANDGYITGRLAKLHENGYVTGIGIFDGTNVGNTPVGDQAGELHFKVSVPCSGCYSVNVEYASGKQNGTGEWLQLSANDDEMYSFDSLLPETASTESFIFSSNITVNLKSGENIIHITNHRRQENSLNSYAAMFYALQSKAPEKDIILSLCEWGKTMPHNWAYKFGNSWRILNDITFAVGRDGFAGYASWDNPGTDSITSQYDKAVIMDEYSNLDLGWNDPDMLVIGMEGISDTMAKSHMAMWCMMNSPLMLGTDLRRVQKGDNIHSIIANEDLIALNQDPLGIQTKRIFSTITSVSPDTTYITNKKRADILVKPLQGGDFALMFQNISKDTSFDSLSVTVEDIVKFIGSKLENSKELLSANKFCVKDLWSKETNIINGHTFSVSSLSPCENRTFRISIAE